MSLGTKKRVQTKRLSTMRFASIHACMLVGCLALVTVCRAQAPSDSEIYVTIANLDHRLFDQGFNGQDIVPFQELISDHFEFYHDTAGLTPSKTAFLTDIQNGLFKLSYRARRELLPGTLRVFPLEKNGVVYGAVETGEHRFSAIETGKPEYFTSQARFTHVWLLEDGAWKLVRGVSYDHQTRELAPEPLDVDAMRQAYAIPVLGVGIIHKACLQDIHVYGELKDGVPAPFNTIFNVASITKTVTTYLTLKLVSQGRWSLDEPLAHYWIDPDVKNDPRAQRLTTRHVLTHETGFPNWRWEAKDRRLAFGAEPGTAFGYSGEGFEYLRRALEHKFHQSLESLAESLVFRPLSMPDTHYTWTAQLDEHRFAAAHDENGRAIVPDHNVAASAADLLKTTVGDYGRFLIAVTSGEGLSKNVYTQMVTPTVLIKADSYMGLGWNVYTNLGDGDVAFTHSGSDPGVKTLTLYLPSSGDGLIIFSNSENGFKIWPDLVRAYFKDKGPRIVDIAMK
jgi:CubicO group peptidase (beta-lactamase class C family)